MEVWFQLELKARADGVPGAVTIGRDDVEGIRAGRQPCVVSRPTIAGIDPILVEAFQLIFELDALRHQQTERGVLKLPVFGSRAYLGIFK